MPDWAWHAVAAPLYLWFGIFRHEAMHAVLVWVCPTTDLILFRAWPHRGADDRFYFGRVWWTGVDSGGWKRAIYLAPHVLNVILITVWTVWMPDREPFHFWAFTTIMLAISPAVDTLYAIGKAIFRRQGDLVDAWRKP